MSEELAKRQGRVAGRVGIVWPGRTLMVERSWVDKACWDLSWLGTVPGGRLLPCWEGSAFPLFPGLLTLSRPICLHPSVPSPPFFPRQAVERGTYGRECGASACCPRSQGGRCLLYQTCSQDSTLKRSCSAGDILCPRGPISKSL